MDRENVSTRSVSSLFGPADDLEMARIWSEETTIECWLEVERAIVSSQSELGLIPADAARRIEASLRPGLITPEMIREEMHDTKHLMVSFIKVFQRACGPSAEHFHLGPTTQDIVDTGLTLQLKASHGMILKKVRRAIQQLIHKSEQYKEQVIMGRTHQQHAVPTTLGYILACWALELEDHRIRCQQSEPRWLLANLSGSVGSQNALVELFGTEVTDELERRICRRLELGYSTTSLHGRLDRFAEVLKNLSGICTSLGRFALNIRFWRSSEVGEVAQSVEPKAHYSSTMPNKENPEECEVIAGIANLVRQLSRSVDEIQMDGIRDSTRIPVLTSAIPQCSMLTSKALGGFTGIMDKFSAVPGRIHKNLKHEYVLQQAVAERVMVAIYRKTGKKLEAHQRLHDCAVLSRRENLPFQEVIRQDSQLGSLFDEQELDELFDLRTYRGNAVARTEQVIRQLEQSKQ